MHQEKSLDVTIRYWDGMFDVTISDPDTGDCTTKTFPYSPDEHPEFDDAIGREIYWYINEMAERGEEE